jgi:hypothetical protein
LGQASKEGFIFDGVIPCPLASKPIQCQTPTDGRVTADAAHGRLDRSLVAEVIHGPL